MTKTKEIILTLPLPPSKNREKNGHWAQTYRLRNKWAKIAYEAWLEVGRPRMGAVTITPHYYVYSLRDEDNCLGQAMKGVIDGLKGNLINDDSPEYLRLLPAEQVVDRKRQRLELHIKAVEAGK